MPLPLIGAIISGGAALVGGLINKKSVKDTNAANVAMNDANNAANLAEQRRVSAENAAAQEAANIANARAVAETNAANIAAADRARLDDYARRDYEFAQTSPAAIRAAAESAGFNPLAFLGQAFQASTYGGGPLPQIGTSFSNVAYSQTYSGSATAIQAHSFGSDIANGASAGVNAYASLRGLQLQQTQMELNNKQETERNRLLALRPTYGGVYSGGAKSSVLGSSASDIADAAGAYNSSDASDDLSKDRRTNWEFLGIPIEASPWFSDAQAGETRGSEPLSWGLGIANSIGDPIYTSAKAWVKLGSKFSAWASTKAASSAPAYAPKRSGFTSVTRY